MGGPFGGGRLRLSPYLGALAATFLIALAVLLVIAIAPLVLEALGRDFTFSGRTKLWGWATHLGMEQPWLGAGYRSFWIDAHTKYFFETFAWNQDANGNLSDSYHGPDHSHSSYVDTFVELGFVGCGLLAVLMLSVFRRMKRAFRSDDVAALPFAAVSLYMIFYSLTERSFLQHTLDIWMLFMIFYFYTSMEIRSPFPAVRPSIRGAPVPGYASDAQIRPAGGHSEPRQGDPRPAISPP
jgi:O-antigen ligase